MGAGKALTSGQGLQTRPMMGKVRKPGDKQSGDCLPKTRHVATAQLRDLTRLPAGKALTSGQGLQTRPMMGKVRSALFDMLLALCSGGPHFPSTTRWLDLYAGELPCLWHSLSKLHQQGRSCHTRRRKGRTLVGA